MLKTVALKHWWELLAWMVVLSAVLGGMVVTGFASDVGTAIEARLPDFLREQEEEYVRADSFGPWSLEERIVRSDVIARVRLRSVARTAEKIVYAPAAWRPSGGTEYVVALEFTFDALEYLKGTGGPQLKAVVDDGDVDYRTWLGASNLGEDLLRGRDKRWDDREAVVFLRKNDFLPSTKRADRYRLGSLRLRGSERYTIANPYFHPWLPDAAAPTPRSWWSRLGLPTGGEGGGASGQQRFLLELPSASVAAEGAQGTSGTGQMITLSALKTRIAQVEAEVAAGGTSTEYTAAEYRECVIHKHKNKREVRYTIARYGGYYPNGITDRRIDISMASGAPAGTHVYWYPIAGEWLAVHGEQKPNVYRGEDWVGGRDAGLFTGGYPVRATTARPLPTGEYRFYYASIPHLLSICDALTKEQKERPEFFVTVTSPAGTVHEAFFDPVAIGAGVGANATNGVLKPTGFSVGGTSTAITGLKWENGAVVLTLSPYVALTGRTLDFIALNGSVSLALPVSSATADATAGTLTWSRSAQPWQSGDKLMLRIRSR